MCKSENKADSWKKYYSLLNKDRPSKEIWNNVTKCKHRKTIKHNSNRLKF